MESSVVSSLPIVTLDNCVPIITDSIRSTEFQRHDEYPTYIDWLNNILQNNNGTTLDGVPTETANRAMGER